MDPIDLPRLGAPFDAALREALHYLDGLPEPIIGVWLAGSVSRGEGDANSDLDLYVLVDAAYRRRIQRFFNGVPTEMFLNSPARARQYFEEDRALGRRPGLDMMAHGLILLDTRGECAAIQAEALHSITLGPNVDLLTIETRRYLVADRLDNAADVFERDPTTARLLASAAVHDAMVLAFIRSGEWAPHDKDLLPVLRERHAVIAAMIDQFTRSGDLDAARDAVEHLLGVSGFYEWETPCEPT